ncbi:hypothetical protein MG295_00228 [Bacillus phage vB_BcgM]|nr:hypothetical protein MG295_00228 [Bacillus phage vB_BcgM]
MSKILTVNFIMKNGNVRTIENIQGFNTFREFSNSIKYDSYSIVFDDVAILTSDISYIEEVKEKLKP